jgi:hypothetical protein
MQRVSAYLLQLFIISPGRASSGADVIELLNFRCKFILAGDLNPKHQFWNSKISNPSGEKLLYFFDVNQFEISAPQFPTHYTPSGNGDVLDIVVHQNIRVSEVIVSDILDSYHLSIIFYIPDHVKIKNLSESIEKFTDWDRIQSFAYELISLKVESNSRVEADKAARDFTITIASADRLSTSKITLLDMNNNRPGIDRLLKYKQKLRKMWQETREPACKTAVNWVTLTPSKRIRPCDLQKIMISLKLKKACGIDDIPNEYLRHLPRRTLVYLTLD